jgi:hypothetical protein
MSDIITIRGPVGCHKSSLALSWRNEELEEAGLSTVVLDLEFGIGRAHFEGNWNNVEIWQPHSSDHNTEYLKNVLMFTKGDVIVGKSELWKEIIEKYASVVTDAKVGRIIIDTAKELWTTNHQSYLQELQEEGNKLNPPKVRKQLISIEYAQPNGRQNNFYTMARQFGKHLILVNHERPKYIKQMNTKGEYEDIPTGEMELDGYNKQLDATDWSIVLTKTKPEDHPTAVIVKNPVSDALMGISIQPAVYNQIMKAAAALTGNGITDGE